MNADELEAKYIRHIKVVGSLRLLPADYALALVDDCLTADVRFLGVEAFSLRGGGVTPAMSYSNTSFGQFEDHEGDKKLKKLGRELLDSWRNNPDALDDTKELIEDGAANGFDWYEVSVRDPATDELLFFRSTST